jgi:hypothetical protein
MATKNTDEVVTNPALEKVKIRIPRTKAYEGDAVVCVNNHDFTIKRGVEVEVPRYVATALREKEQMLETIMLFNEENANK